MQPKNDYSLIAFFPDSPPKKWGYVHRLDKFEKFLNEKFSNWEYVNVYDRRTREFIKRLKNGERFPTFMKAT